jgi:hypothetical protein
MSSYIANIPLPGDLLSKSQQDLNNNFQSANTIFGKNHYPFDEASAKRGKHSFVQMVNNVTKPTTFNNEGTLYTRPFSLGGDTDLWYIPDATGFEYQMTRVTTANFTTFGKMLNNYPAGDGSGNVGAQFSGGWTFLPGGLLYQYGTLFVSGGLPASSGTVKFPVSFTAGTPSVNTIIISLTMISKSGGTGDNNTNSIQNTQVTNDQFKWSTTQTSGYVGFTWSAIGL